MSRDELEKLLAYALERVAWYDEHGPGLLAAHFYDGYLHAVRTIIAIEDGTITHHLSEKDG